MTPLQSRALSWITMFVQVRGYSPTIVEVRDGLDLGDHAAADRLVGQLVQRGFLMRDRTKQRSIELPALPRLCEVPTGAMITELQLRGYRVAGVDRPHSSACVDTEPKEERHG